MDKYNLRQIIIDYPNQLQIGQKFADKAKLNFGKKKYANLILCGMGGSALPGELLTSYLEQQDKIAFPVQICRDYSLPLITSAKSLVFISSYSGNTEETISCFHEALKRKLDIIAFSKGGEIEKIAKENNIPHVKYNINFDHFEPRYATTYAFSAMHQILTKLNIVDTITNYPQIDPRALEVFGEELAGECKNKIPIIYASDKHKAIARNWKIKINENAKHPAFWNYFPELNHNEFVGFSNPKNDYQVLMIKDPDENPRIHKRMDITAELYSQLGIATQTIEMKGNYYLEKVLNTLVLGDWLSYYLALEYDQDPTPVELVEKLKGLLK